MNRKLFSLIAITLMSVTAMAQQALWGGQNIVSPEINPDHTVTFRYNAIHADSVQVTGDFLPPTKTNTPYGTFDTPTKVSMTKDEKGIWSFTSGILSPELYSYSFIVNGISVTDPNNVYLNRDVASVTNILIIKGEQGSKGDLYSVNDVPHGTVSRVWYNSPTLKMQRRMTIYTPAGYETSGKKYPVLYLLHGAGGDEEAWIALGRSAQIMDNLIAMNKAVPMIVVMTNGNPTKQAAPGEAAEGMYKPSMNIYSQKPVNSMEESFPDVMNYIEKNYRTINDKAHRAICGLSMGGGHSLTISKKYPDKFDYVGLFSAATLMTYNKNISEAEKAVLMTQTEKELAAQFKTAPKLYWIGIGNSDFLYKDNQEWRKLLDSKGYKYEYVETDGGHIWRNWRIYLSVFAPKLFK
jgi:Enterochelin esterase and related enzymes